MKGSTVRKKFGNAIKKRREELELSQELLAEKAGVHRNYMGSAERGERNVALENIHKICKALHLTVAELMTEAGL